MSNVLLQDVFDAYCELFTAVENDTVNEQFFKLREDFRAVRRKVDESKEGLMTELTATE